MRGTRALEYTHNGLTTTVTGWAEHLEIKRSAMSNRISRWKNGLITAERCFEKIIDPNNVGEWGGLSGEPRTDRLANVPDRTKYDQEFAPGEDMVTQ